MRYKIYILAALALLYLPCMAVPARRTQAVLRQPDGTTFTAILKGDEYQHIMLTPDGCALVQDADGWYSYAEFDADGGRRSSGIHAGRETAPVSSRNVPYGMLAEKAAARRARMQTAAGENLSRRLMAKYGGPATRSDAPDRHGIVILAQFSDVKFRFTRDDFRNMLTASGYAVNGATGSAKEYFDGQFNGMYDFLFDVTDIVTLSGTRAYYGGNDRDGDDLRPEEMIIEACNLVDPEVDFSIYDDDGDGEVDNVFVFFAGGSEAEYAGDDCIWPHAWALRDGAGRKLELDGKVINSYACASECTTSDNRVFDKMAPIGTFCHEFSHTLGLLDLYDTDYEENGQSDGVWNSTSLMDGGCYNNHGNTPPCYNALERSMLGLAEPLPLPEGRLTLKPLSEGGVAYILNSSNEGEYYLFECRARLGWDKYVGGAGLLVYHVDRSRNPVRGYAAEALWERNMVNVFSDHPCVDILEANAAADGKRANRENSGNTYIADIYFPYSGVNSIAPDGSRRLEFWGADRPEVVINSIALDGSDVTMSVTRDVLSLPPEVTDVVTDRFQSAVIVSFASSAASFSGFARVEYAESGKKDFSVVDVYAHEAGRYAFRLDGLKPTTSYEARIHFTNGDTDGKSTTLRFMTMSMPSNARPYIALNNVERNDDGSFRVGCRLPLVVGGIKDCEGIRWFYNDREISAGADCYFTPTSSGELKADVVYSDGSHDLLAKTIILRVQ